MKNFAALALSLLWSASLALPALGASLNYDPAAAGNNYGLGEISQIAVGKNDDIKDTIANIINIALGFLGILAVIFIMLAGFKWMTAGGNEETVKEARQTILQAAIGLGIVFLAWVITNFVIEQLRSVTEVRN